MGKTLKTRLLTRGDGSDARQRRKGLHRSGADCEHFHHPRYLMQNMQALDRMIAREGTLSGVFA
jgi:hypothetical protein